MYLCGVLGFLIVVVESFFIDLVQSGRGDFVSLVAKKIQLLSIGLVVRDEIFLLSLQVLDLVNNGCVFLSFLSQSSVGIKKLELSLRIE